MIDVSNGTTFPARLLQQVRAITESDGSSRTGCGTGGPAPAGRASVCAQIALLRLVTTEIEADCAVRAGQHAFLTSGTSITVDLHDTGIGTFENRVGPARTQTRRAAALLADADDELEPLVGLCRRNPIDAIAKDPLHQPVLELAGCLACPASRASFEIDRQNELHSVN